jgi:hypothetical protein
VIAESLSGSEALYWLALVALVVWIIVGIRSLLR